MSSPALSVEIAYVNYRGELSLRVIRPIAIFHGSTEFHTEAQWILCADDITDEKQPKCRRDFAMKDIKFWRAAP